MLSSAEEPSLARPGGVSYLDIPTTDPRPTAAFYEQVFGWSIRDANTSSPAFTDPTGNVLGAWQFGSTGAGLEPS